MAWLPNRVFFDTSSLQYAPWRAFTLLLGGTISGSTTGAASGGPTDQTTYITDQESNVYYFDAVFRVEHVSRRKIMSHAVQNGASISDHSIKIPTQVMMEIGMSDVMKTVSMGFVTRVPLDAEMGGGTAPIVSGEDHWKVPTRSIAAYKKLEEWQQSGKTLTVITRLQTYDEMVVENVHTPDTRQTQFGLKCNVTFKELMRATIDLKQTKWPTKSQVTGATSGGSVSPLPYEQYSFSPFS